MGTIPKLNIKGGEGDVQALNRWADAVTTEFADQKTQIHATAQKTTVVTEAVAALPPPAPSVGDGLIHGDKIWEIDPAYVILRDDFLSTNPPVPAAGTLASEEEWWLATPTAAYRTSSAPPYLGAVQVTNDATINDSAFLTLNTFNGAGGVDSGGWALMDYPSWKYVCNFMLQRGGATYPAVQAPAFSMTKVSMYVGLANWQPGAALVYTQQCRPPVFCGVRFDTDLTAPAISDTQFVFETVCNSSSIALTTRNNLQGNTFATGIIPAEYIPYRLEMTCTTAGIIKLILFANDSTQATATLAVPKFVCSPSNEYMSQNGYGALYAATTAGAPIASGSLVTTTGFPTAFNGLHTIVVYQNPWFNFLLAGTVGQSAASPSTLTVNPALFPFFAIGNSSEASPVANAKGLTIDFVSLVWNPGVNGGSGTPNSTKARYW